MKKENGSIEATKKDRKLKDYQNSKVINYVKLFRHFADKGNNHGNSSQSVETVSTKIAESSSVNEEESKNDNDKFVDIQ